MAGRGRSGKTKRKAARPPSRRAPARPAGGRGASSRRALEQSLAEALEQQAATSNILKVISGSPTALQPVLDAVVENAARFCGADDASLFRVEGDRLRGDAHHGPVHQPPGFQLPLARGSLGGRTALERRTIHVADLQADLTAHEWADTAREKIVAVMPGYPLNVISLATWNSAPVTKFLSKEQQQQIVADTMVGGAILTKLIGTSAWYAPGAAGAALVSSIVRDEKKLFTCCVSLDGEYGQKDICLGVPVVIGRNGWEKILDFGLNAEEQALFNKSADAVRSMNDVLKTL